MSLLLSLHEAYRFILSTESIYSEQLFQGFNTACLQLGSSILSTISALIMLAGYLVVASLKLCVMIFPHMLATWRAVVDFHRTKLSFNDICIEIVVVLLTGTFFYFKKRIMVQWRVFEKYVARKSKAAAKAAPHVAFFTLSLLISIIGRKFLVHVTSEFVLPVVTLLIPMYSTIKDLYGGISSVHESDPNLSDSTSRRSSITPTKPPARSKLHQKLTLWVVLAAYHALATAFSLVPFSARIAAILPSVRELAVVVILWAQLSSQFTDIVFDAAKPVLRALASSIPASNFGSSSGASALSLLRMMRLINTTQEGFLKSLLQDSFLVIVAAIFLFTPWRIAYVGVVLVALLYPAFRSSNSIMGLGTVPGGRNNTVGIDEDVLAETRRWLEYWVCAGAMWAARCYGFRMWPSVMMLVALWLQHSWFRGASAVLSSLGGQWCALVHRHRRVKEKRQSDSWDEINDPDKGTAAGSSGQGSGSGGKSAISRRRLHATASRDDNDRDDEEIRDINTKANRTPCPDEARIQTPTPVALRRNHQLRSRSCSRTQSEDDVRDNNSVGSRSSPATGASSVVGDDEELPDGEGEDDEYVRITATKNRKGDTESGGKKDS